MSKTEALQERVTLDLTQRPELPGDYKTFKATAEALQISDETAYQIATEMIQREVAFAARVDAFFNEGRELAHKTWKWFTSTIAATKEPYAVRQILEPRMKAYRRKQEEARRAEEQRLQREADQRRREADAEAARLQAEADAEAAKLRRDGEMKAAREREALAAQQAREVVQTAAALADVGVVLPGARPAGGPGEAMPWVAEVTDIKAICKAIGEGKIPLEYLTPVRGKGEQMVPLVEINMAVLNHLAKRMGREDIGVPGAVGKREVQLRFSRSPAPPPQPVVVGAEGDGW